jgi:hypothetical protein
MPTLNAPTTFNIALNNGAWLGAATIFVQNCKYFEIKPNDNTNTYSIRFRAIIEGAAQPWDTQDAEFGGQAFYTTWDESALVEIDLWANAAGMTAQISLT